MSSDKSQASAYIKCVLSFCLSKKSKQKEKTVLIKDNFFLNDRKILLETRLTGEGILQPKQVQEDKAKIS